MEAVLTSNYLAGILTGLAVAVFFYLRRRLENIRKHHHHVPEIPGALPLVGHLHLLLLAGGNQTLARKLAAFADKYGAVFTVRLGAHPTVVISDCESMKLCFTTNDLNLAVKRPDSVQAKIFSYNRAVYGFAPYGGYLRHIKKILANEVLSLHRIKALRHVRVSELSLLINSLYRRQGIPGKPVIISELLQGYALNIITRIVAGKRYFGDEEVDSSRGRPIGEVIKEFALATGTLVPSDLIPILRWVLPQGDVKAMKRVFEELDLIMESWIEEHKNKRRRSGEDGGGGDANLDLMDVMLSEIKDDVAYGHKRDTIIKATALTVITAGADTTTITLTWILSNLLNNRRVLKRAQDEIDEKVGKDRWVEDSDVDDLKYLEAVVKETLRMYPPAPLSIPREVSEDITIKGYCVPRGTRLVANFWKLHRDPKVWSEPDVYRPERFLTTNEDVEVFGQQFEYLPFGSGRRGCPGTNMAMQMIRLTLARLLQGFLWSAPEDKPVDMTEGLGFGLPKVNPLKVILTPHLSPHLYIDI